MPKKRSRGPTKRKDGLWYGTLTYQGKRRHFYGKTRQEVVDRVAIAKGHIAQGTYRHETRITLAEWLPKWLDHKRRSLSDSSCRSYERQIRRHILPALGHMTLYSIKPYVVQDFADALQMSPETTRKVLTILSAALQHATDLELLPKNPVKAVERPAHQPFPAKPLTLEEAQHLLACNQTERLLPAILLGCCMGMRRGEILGLRWQDIDLKKHILHVRNSLDWRKGKGLVLLPLKTKTSQRGLPLPTICHQALQRTRARDAELALQVGRKLTPTTYVFHRVRDGRAVSPNMLQYAFNQMCDAAGLERRRIHDLRHTFGTLLAKMGESPLAMQKLMGHSSINVTTGLYTHTNPMDYETTMQRLGRALL